MRRKNRLPHLLRPLRHRNYRLLFTGQVVSVLGTWMQTTAQAWLVYALTDSALMLGLTTFCSSISILFLAPFGGMIADRADRRRMLLVTQGASMTVAALLAILTLAGVLQVWHIILFALLRGLIDGFDVPIRHALTLDMVDRGDLRNAIALNSTLFNVARVAGPLLAAIVIASLGEGACFALNAFSYAAVIAAITRMKLPARAPATTEHPLREIAAGYAYSLSNPDIRKSLSLVAVASMFGASHVALMPAFARDVLHGSSETFGILMSAAGIGAFAGAYLLTRFRETWLPLTPAAATVCFGVALLSFSLSRELWTSVPLLVAASTSYMLLSGSTNTVIQLNASNAFRGRAISHYTQCFLGMAPIGGLILGALANSVGPALGIAFGSGIVLVAGTAVVVGNFRSAPGGV